MTTGATKPDWDTPPDGDFAAYVERLTAQAPLQRPERHRQVLPLPTVPFSHPRPVRQRLPCLRSCRPMCCS